MNKLIVRNVKNWDDDIRNVFEDKNAPSYQRILYVRDAKQLSSILSSKRLSLLFDLDKSKNVSEIVKKSKRKQEAVSRDLTLLESFDLIKKEKKGREVFIKKKVKKIEIQL